MTDKSLRSNSIQLTSLVTCWPRTDHPFSSKQTKRDATGITGTGLGVLNGIDVEVLLNKLSATTSDLSKLEHPLPSSLLALGTNQWLLSDILPLWEKINERDHWLIVEALGMVQGNLSAALRCVHTQQWDALHSDSNYKGRQTQHLTHRGLTSSLGQHNWKRISILVVFGQLWPH